VASCFSAPSAALLSTHADDGLAAARARTDDHPTTPRQTYIRQPALRPPLQGLSPAALRRRPRRPLTSRQLHSAVPRALHVPPQRAAGLHRAHQYAQQQHLERRERRENGVRMTENDERMTGE
jgi:hypothetical protein